MWRFETSYNGHNRIQPESLSYFNEDNTYMRSRVIAKIALKRGMCTWWKRIVYEKTNKCSELCRHSKYVYARLIYIACIESSKRTRRCFKAPHKRAELCEHFHVFLLRTRFVRRLMSAYIDGLPQFAEHGRVRRACCSPKKRSPFSFTGRNSRADDSTSKRNNRPTRGRGFPVPLSSVKPHGADVRFRRRRRIAVARRKRVISVACRKRAISVACRKRTSAAAG